MKAEAIDVCVCTFRRASLEATLASLAAQKLPANVALRVVVADNDLTDDRRDDILATGRALGLALTYVHAPSRNISVARNACLDASVADWIAFVDDDEEAAPQWLERLVAGRGGAEIVFGVSQARYSETNCAEWIIAGDFHSNRLQGNDPAWNGYTASVLINRKWVSDRNLRFALQLGQVGGEDTLFFFHCNEAGARFSYIPEAVVFEDTPVRRASLAWLIKRRYRSGQIHAMVLALQGHGRAFAFASGMTKTVYCFFRAALGVRRPVRRNAFILRGAMHVGVVAGALGLSPYLEYGDEQVG